MPHLHRSLAALALIAAANVSAQNCTTTRNASQQDIGRGEGVVLLRSMVAACKSQSPESFFRLQTSGAQSTVAGASDKKSLFANYCEFTSEAVKALGGNIESGTHSIGTYKGRSACGAPASYWFIHTKDGNLALRLAVAIESGQLRIATQ
jgi:hypothetical protein